MRVIAVLDVDEERLAKTGNDFNDRMGRLGRIGITLREYTKMDGISEYEYAAFVWNTHNSSSCSSLNFLLREYFSMIAARHSSFVL